MPEGMVNSYVGIISRRGLESLLPETEHAVLFLLRRVCRKYCGEASCYWAVMQDSAASEIQRHLQWRRYEDALLALRTRATYFGTIAPSDSDDDS
jgi:hypothetical protein